MLAALCCAAAACGTPTPRGAASHAVPPDSAGKSPLAGIWRLAVVPEPEQPIHRPRMELRIDSTVDGRVFGALTQYMAGDVGVDPASFPDFEGRLDAEGVVTLRIGREDPQVAGFVLAGRAVRDTIPLELFVVGPDTASGRGETWLLVRRSTP